MQSVGLQITSGWEPQAKPEATGYSPRAFSIPNWFRFRAGVLRAAVPLDTFVLLTRTLAASASEELILNNGSLADPNNAAVTFATLKVVGVAVTSVTGSVRVGNAGTNPHALWFGATAHTWDVSAGCPPLIGASDAGKVVDSTRCRIKVANLSGVDPVTYQILLAGVKV